METPNLEASSDPVRHTIWRKLVDTLAGAILPVVCFVLGGELRPDWQDGHPSTYVLLLLGEPGTFAFLPLLIPAALAFICAVWWPRSTRFTTTRFFVATGLLLSLPYGLAIAVHWFGDPLGWTLGALLGLPAGAIVIGLPLWAFRFMKFGWKRAHISGVLAAIVVVIGLLPLCIVASLAWVHGEPVRARHLYQGTIAIWLLVVLSSAPFWAFAVYLRRILEWQPTPSHDVNPRGRVAAWVMGGSWLAAWLLTWRVAAARVLASYADLPTRPPTCFLATVAAKGHAGFVGSATASASGSTFPVTSQLRRFKAFEVLLIAFLPWIHRPLRRFYNVVGPELAARVCRPWMADATWLLLKPLEMLAVMWIRFAGQDARRQVERIWPSA